ncbi:DUF2963 domain-containing protein [Candidatus Phytoplasma sp. AldY-WA1]|uniref:DUF2963 domain-containing protein n=1 Tax=Candidatus Phytoplasma sp. AldY-WA1 TaxID=2852100 RepID=UPI00403DFA00
MSNTTKTAKKLKQHGTKPYCPYNKTILYINEYNKNEKLVKNIIQDDGKTISAIHEYNENEKLVKTKFYQDDGKTIKQIN